MATDTKASIVAARGGSFLIEECFPQGSDLQQHWPSRTFWIWFLSGHGDLSLPGAGLTLAFGAEAASSFPS